MSLTQSIRLSDSALDSLTKIPPKTDNKFLLLVYYIRQHWLSYSIGILAVLITNWIAVSIPEYVRLSIDLLTDGLQASQDLLWEYLMIMLGLALMMIVVRTSSRMLFFNPGRAIECQIKNDMFKKLMALQKVTLDFHYKMGKLSAMDF